MVKKGEKRGWSAGRKPRPVIAISPWGVETRYSSGREAARELGLRQSGIAYVLSGARKSTGHYRFKYADE